MKLIIIILHSLPGSSVTSSPSTSGGSVMELLPDTMPVISASTGLLNSDTLKTKFKAYS